MTFLSRLFLVSLGVLFAASLAGCNPTVTGCEAPNGGGAALPDPSFEDSPTKWTLASHSTIDPEKAVCEGSHSLRVQLDSGNGSTDGTRSANFTGLTLEKEYEVRFQFRYENGKDAALRLAIGNYDRLIKFDGVDGTWQDNSFVVTFSSEPAWVELHPERDGAAADFQGSEYDNNLIWVDDFTIKDLAASE